MKKFNLKKIAILTAIATSTIAIANNLTPEPKLNTKVIVGNFDKTAESENFTINNAEITDTARGLTWSRCLVGQTFNSTTQSCDGQATEFATWQDALNSAKDGWRVPNAKELLSIVEETQALPATNTSLFVFANGLNFYGHIGTQETTDTSKWITKSDVYPDEQCIQDTSGWYSRWVGEKSGWECINPKIPAQFVAQTSSPYIWSSTPVAPYSDTDSSKASAEKVYALNLANGSLANDTNRNGNAVGGYSDSANEKRARYVLLVKDAS